MKILIVEDEKRLNQMIGDYLTALEYTVRGSFDGISALKDFREYLPDLVILDLMLPGIDGLDFIRKIRENHATPVIMLTARAEEADKLIGLDSGADDYMTKPFSMKELAARIRALSRRVSGELQTPQPPGELIRVRDLSLDSAKRQVRKRDEILTLTSAQFDILKLLMTSPGRVFTRMNILSAFQEQGFEGYERTIDVHIKNLRKLIEDNPAEPEYILTVWGVGYKFTEPDGGV